MKQNVLYIIFFLLIGFYSCESYYVPEMDQLPSAIVVEGMLTDQNDYTTIKITRSNSFDDVSYYFGEKGATVTIESESGKSYPTREISIGNYQTKEPVQTTVGERYYLKIETSDGEKYRSNYEKMLPSTPIDSIYLTDSTFMDISYNDLGDPIVKDYRGITFSIVPHEPAEAEVGFLYKWNALVNYYVSSSSPSRDFFYYCWKQMSPDQIYVYDYVHDDYINELPLGDLHSLSFHKLSPLPIDSSRFIPTIKDVYSTSFYYHLRQYTITKDGSKFWRSVKNQSEASGKLFDPVEEQIVGNIHCVSDSTKLAFGFFNTASFSHKIIWVKLLYEKHGSVKSVDIMPIAPSVNDCMLDERPDFWY
jgi:hypothetical protein